MSISEIPDVDTPPDTDAYERTPAKLEAATPPPVNAVALQPTSADSNVVPLQKPVPFGIARVGSRVAIGSLVVVPLQKPVPFGIARVLGRAADGGLELQWLSNDQNNPQGKYYPGWMKSYASNAARYFAAAKKSANHKVYTAAFDGVHLHQKDDLIHGFNLDSDCRLSEPLLRIIGEHPHVWWNAPVPGIKAKKGRKRRRVESAVGPEPMGSALSSLDILRKVPRGFVSLELSLFRIHLAFFDVG
jgi:hypothetical protein